MSSTTPAGWYPDPEREGATRWWDGAQWAPSQDPAATDDRFKPKDDADAGAGTGETGAAATDAEPSWSPEPYAGPGSAWDGQDAAASSTSSWNPTPASTPQPSASAPSWQQQEPPSWQPQQSAPAWGQGQQAAAPAYGAPQDFSQPGAQQWNSYGTPPKKSRTGLFVGIGAGVLVLLLLLVGGGIWAVSSFIGGASQVQTQGGGSGGGGTGGAQGPGTWQVEVGAGGGESVTEFEITTAGNYEISVVALNDGDPRITVSGNGQTWEDDDSGEGTDSLLTASLSPGTYTIAVEEYFDDALVASITVTQR
ncbi:DUF2510 domain-containing protein [Agrococcus jejuensis]|uniref:DUF2510 domain-containing protein n=1 Tax=Agrococcus jejuensis TaxID=399736 RepID=UPI0016432228|nr:DUF2510 domain-containing protein [Agrococcus jejuensis]